MNKYKQDTVCPKCGCNRILTEWDKGWSALKRICDRCGYHWLEEPLDGNKDD